MILGDCDNNFVFINALQYMHIFFSFSGFKPKQKTKYQLLILKKTIFAPHVFNVWDSSKMIGICFFMFQSFVVPLFSRKSREIVESHHFIIF